jgi:hypothetical protein
VELEEKAMTAKLEAERAKLAHIRLIEHDTSSSHSEKLKAVFRIARAGTSEYYSASDMHDNPERETVAKLEARVTALEVLVASLERKVEHYACQEEGESR